MSPAAPRSPLARHVRSEPSPLKLQEMRQRAWQQQGVVVLQPEDVVDPWLRQALVNEAVRRYGRRRESGR
jgi:hypothetical protein